MFDALPPETTNIKEKFKASEQQYREFDRKLDFASSPQVSVDDLSYGYEKLDLPVIYKRLLIQPPIFKPNHTPGSHSNLATLVQILPRFKVLAESSTTRLSRIRLDICRDEIDTRYSLMQELGWESVRLG